MKSVLNQCTSCGSLRSLLDGIECTLLYLAKNKDNSLKYNVDTYFDQELFTKLVRYKRVLNRRIYDCDYPCSTIKTSRLIALVSHLVFRENCSLCPDCFPELDNPSPSSSSTTSSSTTTSNTP